MCGHLCQRFLLVVCNVKSFAEGIALLVLGIWIWMNSGQPLDVLNRVGYNGSATAEHVVENPVLATVHFINTAAYVLIGVGGFLCILGFIGCCVICMRNGILALSVMSLFIVAVAELGTGIAVGVHRNQIIEDLTRELRTLMPNYDYVPTELQESEVVLSGSMKPENADATSMWNAMQVWLGCCGINDYTADFANTPYANATRGNDSSFPPPVFCCKFRQPSVLSLADDTCNNEWNRTSDRTSNFNMGCITKAESGKDSYAPIIIGITITVGLLQLLGLVFTCCCREVFDFTYERKVMPYYGIRNGVRTRLVSPYNARVY